MFSQLKYSYFPRVDHGSIVAFNFEGIADDRERLDEIELTFADFETIEEVGFLEDLFLVLEGENRNVLRTWFLT